MASSLKNLSETEMAIPSASGMKFGIVVSAWNSGITGNLLKGVVDTLVKYGASENDIIVEQVPGSFELTLGAQLLAKTGRVDAVVCLGCVIQGDTPHFDYVCQSVTQGVTELNVIHNLPFVFGVLTTNTQQQAEDRAGGKHGNKGDEAAITAIQMVALKQKVEKKYK